MLPWDYIKSFSRLEESLCTIYLQCFSIFILETGRYVSQSSRREVRDCRGRDLPILLLELLPINTLFVKMN